MMNIERVYLFDIDGTLINSGGAGQRAMERALAAVCEIPHLDHDIPAAGRTDRAIIRDLFAWHDIDEDLHRERFVPAYLEYLPGVLGELDGKVLPGVRELLERLCGEPGNALGLLTGNLRDGALHKLRHFGLDHYFQFGGYGDEHLERDDVARLALADARRHAGHPISATDVWVIGDTPSDVTCARAIGARAVAVATGLYSREELAATQPDYLLDDLTQTDAWLTT